MPPVEIQTIAVLREGDLMEGQMKEVDFGAEGGKVLLSRLGNGTVHATSAFCTHNGVSLVNGTLSGDGRVMCPLHGACFNVCTGDIEDAPARSAIHSFKAEVAASHIFVTANPVDTLPIHKSRSFTLRGPDFTTDGLGVVVVGGGAGALNLIESLRENGYKKSITMISSEPYAPIDRTMLSKENITDVSKIELRSVSDLEKNFGVTFRSGVTVTAIDPKAKHVEISGGEKVRYENVVLAMGGAARRLDLPPYERENVYTLRYVQDAKNIDAALKDGKRLVLVGSSFISMELIVAFQERKFASIDVVSPEKYPFQKALGMIVGKGLQKHFEKQGVKFHLGFKVTGILPSKSKEPATAVVLDNGTNIQGDIFVTGIGVVPATEFLKNSGIPLEHDQGIKVDKFLCVPNFDGAYAIGDIAMYPDAPDHSARIEHWNVASNHGRAVGRHIMSKHEPFGKIPFTWSTLGHTLRYVGNIEKFKDSDVIVQGKPEELDFVAYYTENNNVLAIASMQRDPIAAKCSELLRLGLMPSRSEIEAGKDPLEIDISIVKGKGLCGGH